VHAETFRPELDQDREDSGLTVRLVKFPKRGARVNANNNHYLAAVLTTRRQRVIFRE